MPSSSRRKVDASTFDGVIGLKREGWIGSWGENYEHNLMDQGSALVDQLSCSEAKIALFRSQFRGVKTSTPVGSRAARRASPDMRLLVQMSGSEVSVKSHGSSAPSARTV